MGVRKQALSTWLNSDAVPAPPVVVRLARGMDRPVRQLMTEAGYALDDDPLLDVADAWAYVRGEVERMEDAAWTQLTSATAPMTPDSREALLTLPQQLQDRALLALRSRHPDSVDGADLSSTFIASAPSDTPVSE